MGRRPSSVRNSGPYRVDSYSQNGDGKVFLVVHPRYPKHGDDWPEKRAHGHGGGPGMFTSIALGHELADFLNAPYSSESVEEWKNHEVSTQPPWRPSFKHKFKTGAVLDITKLDNLICDRCDQRLRRHIFGACPDRWDMPVREGE